MIGGKQSESSSYPYKMQERPRTVRHTHGAARGRRLVRYVGVQGEKFGDTKISGNIYITTEYPSCPYCGAKGFFQCAECGRTTCWNGETETVCEWCGNEAETAAEEKFDSITGGGF